MTGVRAVRRGTGRDVGVLRFIGMLRMLRFVVFRHLCGSVEEVERLALEVSEC